MSTGRRIINFACAVIVLVLIIVSVTQPWYRMVWRAPILGSFTLDFTLQGYSINNGDSSKTWMDDDGSSKLKEVYNTCAALVWIGFICYLVTAGLLLLDVLPFCKGKVHRMVRFICLVAAVIGCIALILGALFLLRQPSALQKDSSAFHLSCSDFEACKSFSGSDDFGTWGPYHGWWFCWAAAFMSIVTVAIIGKHHHRKGYTRI